MRFRLPEGNANFGLCVLSDAGATLGVAVMIRVVASAGGRRSGLAIIGRCGDWSTQGGYHGWMHGEFEVLEDEREVELRVLTDRSIVETFVSGGRAVLTKNYVYGVPNPPAAAATHDQAGVSEARRTDRNTTVHAIALGSEVVLAQATVYSMGCMWKTDDHVHVLTIDAWKLQSAFNSTPEPQVPERFADHDWRNVSTGNKIWPAPGTTAQVTYQDQPQISVLADGSWFVVWTHGVGKSEGARNIILSMKSFTKGRNWTAPVNIEPLSLNSASSASWANPLVVGERLYVFYTFNCYNTGRGGNPGSRVNVTRNGAGRDANLQGCWFYKISENGGRSFGSTRYNYTGAVEADMRFSLDRTNPYQTGTCKAGEHCPRGLIEGWSTGKPLLAANGVVYMQMTKIGGPALSINQGIFLRSRNLRSATDPADVVWDLLPQTGGAGFRALCAEAGAPFDVLQEGNIVEIDSHSGTFYAIARTNCGWITAWKTSSGGDTWSSPMYAEYDKTAAVSPNINSRGLKQPCGPLCPRRIDLNLSGLSSPRYLLLFYNNGFPKRTDSKSREVYWISAGRPTEDGTSVIWSQPEVAFYEYDQSAGDPSAHSYKSVDYPDFIFQDGDVYVAATNKDAIATHLIPRRFWQLVLTQNEIADVVRDGSLVIELNSSSSSGSQQHFRAPDWNRSFTIEILIGVGFQPAPFSLPNSSSWTLLRSGHSPRDAVAAAPCTTSNLSLTQCGNACITNADCRYFWFYQSGRCCLKSSFDFNKGWINYSNPGGWYALSRPPPAAKTALLDCRDSLRGKGVAVFAVSSSTSQNARPLLVLDDGSQQQQAIGDADPWSNGVRNTIAVVVDGAAQLVSFLSNGVLADGGLERQQGWTPINQELGRLAGGECNVGVHVEAVRVYSRALMTTELVGSWRSGMMGQRLSLKSDDAGGWRPAAADPAAADPARGCRPPPARSFFGCVGEYAAQPFCGCRLKTDDSGRPRTSQTGACCHALAWGKRWQCAGCPRACSVCRGSGRRSGTPVPCSAIKWGAAWHCQDCPKTCTIDNCVWHRPGDCLRPPFPEAPHLGQCLPPELAPFTPIFHMIGSVWNESQGGSGVSDCTFPPSRPGHDIAIGSINDVNGILAYKGVYHIFHQVCAHEFGHVVSEDLVHWRRLRPPLVPNGIDAKGAWDGSISVVDGVPVLLYDAKPGGIAVAHPADPADRFLEVWNKDDAPIEFGSTRPGYVSNVWKVASEYNFLSGGWRYTTTDSALHKWSRVQPKMITDGREEGGQWFMELPRTVDGSPPPLGNPSHIVNVANGQEYQLGYYNSTKGSWTPWSQHVTYKTELGPDAGWFGGSRVDGRTMNIGWALWGVEKAGTTSQTAATVGVAAGGLPTVRPPAAAGERLTVLREVKYDPRLPGLVSNPIAELAALRNATLANETTVTLTPGSPHTIAGTSGGAAASSDVLMRFRLSEGNATFGLCVLSDAGATLGVAVTIRVVASAGGQRSGLATIGRCGDWLAQGGYHGWMHGEFEVLEDEREVELRVLTDRSIVEAFVSGGRAVLTKNYVYGVPNPPAAAATHDQAGVSEARRTDRNTTVHAIALGSEVVLAQATVYSMGCMWKTDDDASLDIIKSDDDAAPRHAGQRPFVANMTDPQGKKYACFRIPALQRVGKTILLFAEGRAGTPGYGFVCRDHGDVRIVLRRSTDEGPPDLRPVRHPCAFTSEALLLVATTLAL
jgi:sucrose-6-phosphate hydrolase SacC (GH32 family)